LVEAQAVYGTIVGVVTDRRRGRAERRRNRSRPGSNVSFNTVNEEAASRSSTSPGYQVEVKAPGFQPRLE
jgi:hypothetical protein